MATLRTCYQYHHLSEKSKRLAAKEMKGTLLTQWLYNVDGTQFQSSTTIQL